MGLDDLVLVFTLISFIACALMFATFDVLRLSGEANALLIVFAPVTIIVASVLVILFVSFKGVRSIVISIRRSIANCRKGIRAH